MLDLEVILITGLVDPNVKEGRHGFQRVPLANYRADIPRSVEAEREVTRQELLVRRDTLTHWSQAAVWVMVLKY